MWNRETAGVYRLRQECGQVVSVERVRPRGKSAEELEQERGLAAQPEEQPAPVVMSFTAYFIRSIMAMWR